MYCEKCHSLIEGKKCPVCGSKKVREPLGDDLCYLIEKEMIWGEMLADVLKQNEIPYLYKESLGAAVTIQIGAMLERYRFFVAFSHYERAKDIVEGLFPEG